MQTSFEFTNNCTEVTTDLGAVGHYRQQRVALETCVLLGYYSVYSGNSLPMFWYYLSVVFSRFKKSPHPKNKLSSWIFWPLNMRPICSTKTSARNYHYTLRNNPEEGHSNIIRRGTKKSRKSLTWIVVGQGTDLEGFLASVNLST